MNSLGSTLQGKVLYIEDQPINMELVEAMLEQFPGITLIKASTGWEGVRVAREELPDLILLDMHLPDIGGLEVVRALSELISNRHLRVILLTAESFTMDIVKAMSLGAHDYWVKPISLERLEAGLVQALQGRRAS